MICECTKTGLLQQPFGKQTRSSRRKGGLRPLDRLSYGISVGDAHRREEQLQRIVRSKKMAADGAHDTKRTGHAIKWIEGVAGALRCHNFAAVS
jgi:hypothetical protein